MTPADTTARDAPHGVIILLRAGGHIVRCRAPLAGCDRAFQTALESGNVEQGELWSEDQGDRTMVKSFRRGGLKTELIRQRAD